MKVGILGAGAIGATIARKLASNGHRVKLANSRSADTIRELARDSGVVAVDKADVVKDVDAIILSIPFGKYPDVATLLAHVPNDVPLIDTSNYYGLRDGAIPEIQDGKTEGVWVSEQIGKPIVKAWNAVLADTLSDCGKRAGEPGRLAIPVAGNDPNAKAIAIQLVDATGFDGLDAGSLEESWRLQPGTPAWCTELTHTELKAAVAKADKERVTSNIEALIQAYGAGNGELTHDDIVAIHRSATA
jgi:predicted dinucleotide-binding enzyme